MFEKISNMTLVCSCFEVSKFSLWLTFPYILWYHQVSRKNRKRARFSKLSPGRVTLKTILSGPSYRSQSSKPQYTLLSPPLRYRLPHSLCSRYPPCSSSVPCSFCSFSSSPRLPPARLLWPSASPVLSHRPSSPGASSIRRSECKAFPFRSHQILPDAACSSSPEPTNETSSTSSTTDSPLIFCPPNKCVTVVFG